MIVTSLRLVGVKVPEEVYDFVKRFKRNGGSGMERANLKDSFYAFSILGHKDKDTVNFVIKHECEEGNFAKHPHARPPYLEETFYAVSTLNILGYSYRNEKMIKYILSLQNPDGRFRRSVYGGISTLEDCYHAIASLKLMVELR